MYKRFGFFYASVNGSYEILPLFGFHAVRVLKLGLLLHIQVRVGVARGNAQRHVARSKLLGGALPTGQVKDTGAPHISEAGCLHLKGGSSIHGCSQRLYTGVAGWGYV